MSHGDGVGEGVGEYEGHGVVDSVGERVGTGVSEEIMVVPRGTNSDVS